MQIIFLGRAHTGGDLAVYFPDSKVVFTGDMAFAGPSFLGDGYVDEWPQTLRNLMELDFDIFVPGHGGPVTDLSRLELVAQYYEDLWVKAEALHHDGVPYDQAAKTIDLTNHTSIPIRNVGADPLAIQRVCLLQWSIPLVSRPAGHPIPVDRIRVLLQQSADPPLYRS
jgi:glyoxylase-like metal-dependent hydrolase (beta-lactamase superfamily II)